MESIVWHQVFNLVSLLAIFYSPKKLSNNYANPMMLKIFVVSSICLTFVSALLVSINLEKFEVLAHELEYINEFVMSMFDCIILSALVLQAQSRRGSQDLSISQGIGLGIVLPGMIVAAVQLGIYNLSGWTADGDSKGEQLAHYCEFSFGIFSAGVTFWFTVDSKLLADRRLAELMYRPEAAVGSVSNLV